MPAATLVMPKLGLTMEEGLLAEWKVAPGDRFRAGDILYVVETDKISNEIEAGEDGELGEILVSTGETVPVGTVVAQLARRRPDQRIRGSARDGNEGSCCGDVKAGIVHARRARRSAASCRDAAGPAAGA